MNFGVIIRISPSFMYSLVYFTLFLLVLYVIRDGVTVISASSLCLSFCSAASYFNLSKCWYSILLHHLLT